ncbi:MAG: hypothetical protein RL264_2408 [Bacteroidota bacterium]
MVALCNRMLTLEKCKLILKEESKKLTDAEILEIRDMLGVYAEILIGSAETSNLFNHKDQKNGTCDHLHESFN